MLQTINSVHLYSRLNLLYPAESWHTLTHAPSTQRLRQGDFELKVRLCGENPSQQKQYCIPFSWSVSFSVFLSENYGCDNKNLEGH